MQFWREVWGLGAHWWQDGGKVVKALVTCSPEGPYAYVPPPPHHFSHLHLPSSGMPLLTHQPYSSTHLRLHSSHHWPEVVPSASMQYGDMSGNKGLRPSQPQSS